ncbi:hypothetical protein VNO77_02946 [Canavalia gladiata]|uniref:Uncharacterized protein n=1 Tax=Canavalia gladiata TaxID=3824 RepID=A0AAN9MYV5_CANGL
MDATRITYDVLMVSLECLHDRDSNINPRKLLPGYFTLEDRLLYFIISHIITLNASNRAQLRNDELHIIYGKNGLEINWPFVIIQHMYKNELMGFVNIKKIHNHLNNEERMVMKEWMHSTSNKVVKVMVKRFLLYLYNLKEFLLYRYNLKEFLNLL